MKRYLFIFIAFLLVAACTTESGEYQAESWEQVQEFDGGNITVLYVPSEGFSYVDEEENLTGVTIELMRDFVSFVEEEYNVSLNVFFEPIDSFSDFYQTVVDGRDGLFGVANVTITEERRDELAFSPSYLNNIAVLITDDQVDTTASLDEIPEAFEGLTGLAFEGTLHEDRIRVIIDQYLPDADIEMAQSNAEIIDRTAEKGSYFAYVDIYNFWRAADEGKPLLRHEAGDDAAEQFGVIMPKDTDWEGVIDHFFSADGGYVHSEKYHDHLRNHLGEELAELLIDQF